MKAISIASPNCDALRDDIEINPEDFKEGILSNSKFWGGVLEFASKRLDKPIKIVGSVRGGESRYKK